MREPRPAGWWIVPAALLVGGAVCAVAWWLLSSLPAFPTTAAEAAARQGALQVALTAGAGIGAAITVMLAFRRQRHQELTTLITSRQADRTAELAERVAEYNRQDAIERRITELYAKAVEQLGSGKAAVRLGGLYALERLAQGNPDHRQTIVNVICAYLRMPYTAPAVAATNSLPPGPWHTEADFADQEGERQVRLTAQRILAEHLRDERTVNQRETTPAGPHFWEAIDVDLSGATLINMNFNHCRAGKARFNRSVFVGAAFFRNADFGDNALFYGAQFKGEAWFSGANFEYSVFSEAVFESSARFSSAIFARGTEFHGVTFVDPVWFSGSRFGAMAWFDEATFNAMARFDKATFKGAVIFNGAEFNGAATFTKVTAVKNSEFRNAVFSKEVDFSRARFSRSTLFDKATFKGNAEYGEAIFEGTVSFVESFFMGKASFVKTVFSRKVRFENVRTLMSDAGHSWPGGWTVVVGTDGTGMLRRDDATPSASDPAPAEEE
ncbi:pentapeptide repeat-containing protein [Streptosporangium sp. G11]|uniref:pentapeptide repeat-containing protein n=1 Tax=Streptosporangium sp. G11 TaxID=3436926 RepID=UPI003EB744FB